MKTTVEALKDYYTEIGGTSTDVENVVTIPDMIDAITALGGGSSLPEVTADDNGDVLTVIEGEWGKVTPTKDTVVIKCANGKLPNGMKCSDVVAFINAGKEVVIYDNSQYYRVANEAVSGTTFIFIGLGYNTNQSSFFISYISVTNNGSTSVNAGVTKFITTS